MVVRKWICQTSLLSWPWHVLRIVIPQIVDLLIFVIETDCAWVLINVQYMDSHFGLLNYVGIFSFFYSRWILTVQPSKLNVLIYDHK